jgi:hypothetical protein
MLSRCLCAVVGLIFCLINVQGQGIIIPRPCPRQIIRCPLPVEVPQQPLKVKSILVSTKINDQVAITRVEQVFENDTPYVIEGVYFFPLPENVSITEFAMWDGLKRLVGEVRSRDEARRIYNDIVRSRRDPALLEYAGKNLFQASIFPIQPNSEKKIELIYNQVLRNENGTVGYRYPLGTGWRANRFDPPRPLPQPRPRYDPENQLPRSDPRFPPAGRVSAEVEITSRIPIKGIYSPSHEIEVKRDGERKARLSFEVRASASQPDFQLFYTLSEKDFGMSLMTYREPGKDGYFMLLVSPKAELDSTEILAKDIIFVLDTSGSMAEDGKMEKAKAALRFGINSLDARDRFNIISFAGEEHLMSEGLIAANGEGKREGIGFIERMRATGGTNINDALIAAFKQVQAGERPKMVILITDGQPTVGITHVDKILSNANQANKTTARLFTIGVGYDINTLLLDKLAADNRGTVGYIEPNEDIEVKVSNFFAKVNHPVLSDVKIDWSGIQTDLVYPRVTPDIFNGSQLVLVGRYRPGSSRRLALLGKVNGRERRFDYDNQEFPEKQTENEFLPHLWAIRRVGHLLDQIRMNGESKELRDEIVDLGTRYGIVTPYTSYLVLEPGMRNLSQNMPTHNSEIRRANRDSAIVGGVVSGRSAVTDSIQRERLSNAEAVTEAVTVGNEMASTPTMRKVAGKTFYLQDGVWTDSEYKTNLPVITLKFASEEYFNLLTAEPKLSDFFSLGQRLIVVWKGKVYRIEES